MNKIIVIGGFSESIELCEDLGLQIVGVVDSVNIDNYNYLGEDRLFIEKRELLDVPVFLTPDQPSVRKWLFMEYQNAGYLVANLVANDVTCSNSASISNGTVIYKRVNISSNVNIGVGVRINALANIMHDCFVGDFSTIAPSAVLLGGVNIGSMTYVGANATILPDLKIGDNSIIGAGSVVTKNVPSNTVYCGNPAKFLRRIND